MMVIADKYVWYERISKIKVPLLIKSANLFVKNSELFIKYSCLEALNIISVRGCCFNTLVTHGTFFINLSITSFIILSSEKYFPANWVFRRENLKMLYLEYTLDIGEFPNQRLKKCHKDRRGVGSCNRIHLSRFYQSYLTLFYITLNIFFFFN